MPLVRHLELGSSSSLEKSDETVFLTYKNEAQCGAESVESVATRECEQQSAPTCERESLATNCYLLVVVISLLAKIVQLYFACKTTGC
jgi:hypothetical protein